MGLWIPPEQREEAERRAEWMLMPGQLVAAQQRIAELEHAARLAAGALAAVMHHFFNPADQCGDECNMVGHPQTRAALAALRVAGVTGEEGATI